MSSKTTDPRVTFHLTQANIVEAIMEYYSLPDSPATLTFVINEGELEGAVMMYEPAGVELEGLRAAFPDLEKVEFIG